MTQFLSLDGRQLEYSWHGPPPDKATTLIFLHEGLGCVALWRDFPAAVAAETGCGALVYSRFGYGRSAPVALPRPLSYMHDEALEVLPQLLAALQIRNCILVGHSDGGSIALIYAGGTAAEPLRGVVTLAAHIFCEPISVASIVAIQEPYERGDLRQKLARYHGENVDCAFWGWNRAWLDPKFLTDWNLTEFLPHIRVPVLAIQGKDDEYGTAAQIEAIAAEIPNVQTLMLPNCGHTPQREQREATLEAITQFIRRLL